MISKKTKYALHALVRLAKEYDKGPILITEISEKEKVPKKFLEAILLDLKNAGFLNSKKGKGGGYYLIKHPDEVNLAEIIRLFEGALAMLPCVTHKFYERCEECKDELTCGLRQIIQEVRDATVNLLKGHTLSDIVKKEEELKMMLKDS